MQKLEPFEGLAEFDLRADATIEEKIITFQYKLDPHASVLGLKPNPARWSSEDVPRADNLWSTTCFEAFLNPVGSNSYFEFNFSLKPAWNVYEFVKYREPQPPLQTSAFRLDQMSWDFQNGLLQVQVENQSSFESFRIGLTAVLEAHDHNKHYLALTHQGPKPDFHVIQSFILQRESQKGS